MNLTNTDISKLLYSLADFTDEYNPCPNCTKLLVDKELKNPCPTCSYGKLSKLLNEILEKVNDIRK